MILRRILIPMVLCLGLSAAAQNLGLTIGFPSETRYDGMKVFVRPADAPMNDYKEMSASGLRQFKAEVPVNADGIYYVCAYDSVSQISVPFYIPSGSADASFTLSASDYKPATTLTGNANKALVAYAGAVADKQMILGKKASELSNDSISRIIGSFITDADSIIAVNPMPAQVAGFIRLWALTSASDSRNMAEFFVGRSGRKLDFPAEKLMPENVAEMLDTPMANSFHSSVSLVVMSLPEGTFEERMAALYRLYGTPGIRKKAADKLVNSFMDSVDYVNEFASGESRLKAVLDQYSLAESYLDSFRARRATVVGAPFPDVALVDREGNRIDFSSFRGKYVYVDLWASWCVPCCREVPYLQELEKEMADSNVAFVSISVDSSQKPWLKKMELLNMHGNQLWNSDGELIKKLNVRGIPHFVIYDPEGKLKVYNAPRPSSDKIKDLLKSLE